MCARPRSPPRSASWCAFGLGFLGLFGNPLLIFIAIFVYLAASSEAQLVAIRAMSRDVPVSAAMMTEFATLTPDEHIDAAVETLLRTSQSEFPVVDAEHRLVGLLDRDDMIRALKTLGPDARVGEAMTTDVPTVGHPQLPRGRVPHPAGEVRARGRRRRCGRPPGRPDHLGDGRRDADGAATRCRRARASARGARSARSPDA